MILYYGLTNYHLLCSILHKIIYCLNEKAIFVTSDGRLKNRIENLKNSKIFNEVFYIEDKKLRDQLLNEKLTKTRNLTKSTIEDVSQEYMSKYEKLILFDLKNIDKLYILADHGAFGLYLLMKKYKYIYIEDASGIYSKWKNLDRILKEKDPGMQIMCEYYNAYGRNNLITEKYVSFKSQLSDCDLSDCIDFDINNLIDKLNQEELNTLVNIFGFKKYEVNNDKKNALILTQRFSTFNLLTRKRMCAYVRNIM